MSDSIKWFGNKSWLYSSVRRFEHSLALYRPALLPLASNLEGQRFWRVVREFTSQLGVDESRFERPGNFGRVESIGLWALLDPVQTAESLEALAATVDRDHFEMVLDFEALNSRWRICDSSRSWTVMCGGEELVYLSSNDHLLIEALISSDPELACSLRRMLVDTNFCDDQRAASLSMEQFQALVADRGRAGNRFDQNLVRGARFTTELPICPS